MRERIRGLIGAFVLATITLLSYPAISAGSVAGEPVTAEFNYLGLYAGLFVAGDFDELVHTPLDGDPLIIQGRYTDADGNFTVSKGDGFAFPPVVADFGFVKLNGDFALASEGSGQYDETTGELQLDLDLAVKIGIDDLDALSSQLEVPFGSGELLCEVSPLEISLSTDGDWPHPGKAYENKAKLVDGAVSGIWRKAPGFLALKGDQADCDRLRGFLKPVGGIWLANSTETIDEMPGPSLLCPVPSPLQSPLGCKGPPPACPDQKSGAFPHCEDKACPPNMVGEWPDCSIVDPPMFCSVRAVGLTGKARLRAGKKMKVRLTVKNVGTRACVAKVALRSSNRQVKIPRRIAFTVPAGKTTTRMVTVRTTRRARGKSVLRASYAGKKAIARFSIKKK